MKRAALALGGIALAAVLLAVLVGPALVDTPAVRAEIQQRLARALQGEVAWESLELALLPAPHGELRRLRVEIPGRLSARAEEVDVRLRLWPLLLGRAEVSSFTVIRPGIRVEAAGGGGDADALAAYRSAVQALQGLAPDTRVRIQSASLEPWGLRDLDVDARTAASGLDLKLSTASARWKRLSVDGRIDYADLSARARVEVDALLRAEVRTDARSTVEADLSDVDLAAALALAEVDFPGSVTGKASARVHARLEKPWRVDVALLKSDAAVKLAQLPWPISVHAGRIALTPEHLQVEGVAGGAGDSAFSRVALRMDLRPPVRITAASGSATLKLEQWFPWLRPQLPPDAIDSLSGSLEVALERLALRLDRPAEADYAARVTPRGVAVALAALPAPVAVDGGAVHVERERVRFEKLALAVLDARTQASGTYSLKPQRLELALADGVAGEKLVRWALGKGEVPERFEPRTPLRFAAKRIAWQPQGALEADADLALDGGPALGVAFAWRPERLELRRLAITDAQSDAVLGATVAGDLIRASFSGKLHGGSIPALLRQPLPAASGEAAGELRVTIDRKRPERTAAEGRLSIAALDLSWLAGRKALVERAQFVGEGEGGRITAARFALEDQVFELRGAARRTPGGPVIEARIESEGFDALRLLPPPDPNAPRRRSSALWPLPVSGRVEVRTGFVQYKDYRIAPFDGVLLLEPRRARLEVKEARMCGVSFPMEIEAAPGMNSAAVHVTMKDQPLEKTVPCLTGGNVELTGSADLTAELRTQGERPHLLRDMTGTAHAELRKGTVKKFALLGNILSFRGIASPDKMRDDGFPYRSIAAKGRFEGGRFLVEESFFDSDAVRLAAHGRVDMLGADSQLTVLVGLLTNVDRLAGAIPIIGDIFGGSMTALPVSVRGDIRDPTVVPLGPRAVTEQLLGIFERTLKLPGKLVVPAEKPVSP